jgi:hypothetical protein
MKFNQCVKLWVSIKESKAPPFFKDGYLSSWAELKGYFAYLQWEHALFGMLE